MPRSALSIDERFWAKVRITGSCWEWTAYRSPDGYGKWCQGRKSVSAHRWSYERFVGPIPEGLVLDHLCRVRHCVNPAHLEPVTIRENIMRGEGIAAIRARRTHCPNGHELTDDNVYQSAIQKAGRLCKTCRREKNRKANGWADDRVIYEIHLKWLNENPGKWRLWAKKRYPYTNRHVRGPKFERKYIRDIATDEWEFWVRKRMS